MSEDLLELIGALRTRVAALVRTRSADDPTAGDPLRGLYVTGETALRIATAAPGTGAPGGTGAAGAGGAVGTLGAADAAGTEDARGVAGTAGMAGVLDTTAALGAAGTADAAGTTAALGAAGTADAAGTTAALGAPGTARDAGAAAALGAPGTADAVGTTAAPGAAGTARDAGAAGPAGRSDTAGGSGGSGCSEAPAGPPTSALAASPVPAPEGDGGGRLPALVRAFGLSALDAQVLLAALAPEVDRGFEALYGYLNDDVGRRRATVGLALDLAGTGPADPVARGRFHPAAPLRAGGLLRVEDEDGGRPLPGRALRVPERVVAHLLGDDSRLAARLAGVGVELLPPTGAGAGPDAGYGEGPGSLGELAARIAAAGPVTVHLRERVPGAATDAVVTALRVAGRPVLRYRPGVVDAEAARVLLREARLRGAAVVVEPLPPEPGPLVRALAAGRATVVLAGGEAPDPTWVPAAALVALEAPGAVGPSSVELWRHALGESGSGRDDLGRGGFDRSGFDLAEAVAPYRLGGDQIRRAASAARALADFEGGALTRAHVQRGARLVSAPLLDSRARRVRPAVGFADIVLPEEPLGLLRELTGRARHRDRVLGEWRLRTGGGRGRGVVALFAGESGTGKTLGAEVVAGELGLDLYVVDLSSVVDKYVGETEKNLERIFAEVDRTDCVLLFDEADAVFGKRSEVRSSHDRYANLESAYLLQRLEAFDGIAVLTTNLRANIDEAFTRRLDLVVDFPFPDAEQRVALWRSCLAGVPHAEGLDEEVLSCAKEFELAGGAIRSAAVTAGYLAAARGAGAVVTGEDLRAGARREYRKAGRLVADSAAPWSP